MLPLPRIESDSIGRTLVRSRVGHLRRDRLALPPDHTASLAQRPLDLVEDLLVAIPRDRRQEVVDQMIVLAKQQEVGDATRVDTRVVVAPLLHMRVVG